jgi:hypothetical protein
VDGAVAAARSVAAAAGVTGFDALTRRASRWWRSPAPAAASGGGAGMGTGGPRVAARAPPTGQRRTSRAPRAGAHGLALPPWWL